MKARRRRVAPAPLVDPVDGERIRTGQRRLIFATATRVGLRDEQLHDLVEWASGDRTRAIAQLTIGEARRLTGIVKTLERNGARYRAELAQRPARTLEISEDVLRRAAQQAARARPAGGSIAS